MPQTAAQILEIPTVGGTVRVTIPAPEPDPAGPSAAAPWVLFDFRSPVRMNRHQQGYNRKGLVSDQGVRKLAFQVVRDRYEAWRKKHEGK